MDMRRLSQLALTAVALSACGDAATAPGREAGKPRIEIVSGNNQTGEVGKALLLPLVVKVLDSFGIPVTGRAVLFSDGRTAFPDSAMTDARGIASMRWTLGGHVGVHRVDATATLPGVARFLSASLRAVAVAGPAARIVAAAGDSAVALPETVLDTLEAYVTDQFGNRLAAVAVEWTVHEGGGAVITEPVSRSDTMGIARAVWRLGPAQGRNLLAAAIGDTTVRFVATSTTPLVASAVVAGGGHSCALGVASVAYCWGSNHFGQLGDGVASTSARKSPVSVRGPAAFLALVVGGQHTCGLTAAGVAYCWGEGSLGQLGNGAILSRNEPTAVNAGLPGFTSLAAGRTHTCGITQTGAALCWGDNTFGQLGDSTKTLRAAPSLVRFAQRFTALVAGDGFTCGLSAEGDAYCWGRNEAGQLGSESNDRCDLPIDYYYGPSDEACSLAPLSVVFGATQDRRRLLALAAGGSAVCGLTRDGLVYCWGAGDRSPRPVADTPALTSVTTGDSTACATTGDGRVYCWPLYQEPTDPHVPWRHAEGLLFETLSGAGSHFCGVLNASHLTYCWGANDVGQLGDGTTQARASATKVVSPIVP